MNRNIKILTFLFLGILIGCSEETFVPLQMGMIYGTVLSDQDYEGLENVTIKVTPSVGTTVTDESGYFEFFDVEAGTYSLQVSKTGYLSDAVSLTVKATDTTETVVTLQKIVEENRAPAQPLPVQPADGTTLDTINELVFTWQASDPDNDTLYYSVRLFSAEEPTGRWIAEEILDTFLIFQGLHYQASYQWQVVVHDQNNPPVFGPVNSFSTIAFPDQPYLFVRQEGNFNIYASCLESEQTCLTTGEFNTWRPRMSPLRDKVAFICDEGITPQIFLMDRDGTNLRKLTSAEVGGINAFDLDFAWAPRGDRLYFMRFDKLYSINQDGTGRKLHYQAPEQLFISEVDIATDEQRIAVKMNSATLFSSLILIFDQQFIVSDTVLSDVNGRSGGLHFSVDGRYLLYTHDVSGYQGQNGRMLDSRIFLYDLQSRTHKDLSEFKPAGTNDLDPRFSPNNASIIFTNINNDGLSNPDILVMDLQGEQRKVIFENAMMPEWN